MAKSKLVLRLYIYRVLCNPPAQLRAHNRMPSLTQLNLSLSTIDPSAAQRKTAFTSGENSHCGGGSWNFHGASTGVGGPGGPPGGPAEVNGGTPLGAPSSSAIVQVEFSTQITYLRFGQPTRNFLPLQHSASRLCRWACFQRGRCWFCLYWCCQVWLIMRVDGKWARITCQQVCTDQGC
jgi:hypothetical protein